MASYILPFEKMHGLGNDFVMLHYKHLPENISEQKLAQVLCDRRFGVGADGIIVAKPSTEGEDFSWEYLNADGSYGEMCGNGMRCYAKYLFDRGIAKSEKFTVETRAGVIEPEVLEGGYVKVNMGQPILSAADIPVSVESDTVLNHLITAIDKEYKFDAVSMGNPHAIIWLESESELDDLDITKYGSDIEVNELFPEKVNVEFVYQTAPNEIKMRVWERGSGITLACGTGACAIAVSAILQGKAKKDETITIHLPGGPLDIVWQSSDNNIMMSGPATSVYIGQIELDL